MVTRVARPAGRHPSPVTSDKILAVKKRIVLLALLVMTSACAAHRQSPADPAAAASADAISERSVRAHMEFLASDALNGRGSGTRDEWIAVTYVASQLRRLGLEPMETGGSYVQTIEIERPELGAAPVLTLGGTAYTHGTHLTVATMSAPSITGTVAPLTQGTPAPKGSVVVVKQVTREMAADLGPAALVLATANGCGGARAQPGALPRVSPRTVGAPAATTRPTCVALGDEAFAAATALAAGARVTLEGEVKTVQKAHTWNAVGKLTGADATHAREVILLSAHIDHVGTGRASAAGAAPAGDTIYNGADDDASGSIAVLELAEAIARGKRPQRTIVFAWFGSEEAGGTGSRYFADRPVVPLDRIIANLQFEMIGRPDAKVPPHTLWLTGYERSNLGPELARRGAKLVQDPHPDQSFFTRSDNIQFARRGVIAHTVSSFGLHTDYHQPSDEIATIDFAHMTDAIQSMLEPIRWLASSRFVPEWLPGQRPL
jgi:aminopeptidase YwaD